MRGICGVVGALDRTAYESRARSSQAGRRALDTRALAALAVWGMAEGARSAKRCETDAACPWVLGGEKTNRLNLSDFLRQEREMLESILSRTVLTPRRQCCASFETLLVDGTCVTVAGRSSVRTPFPAIRRHIRKQRMRTLKRSATRAGWGLYPRPARIMRVAP